ncbi:pentatricopeptide repeat-containing protein At2g01390 isoform X1 [Typha angustifolia]|uniref:pentatricopeptide repeat-containing protein At2g01390 isoform X1 n=1 Tax=Typha angustifolia TaxID=59011 RepID=UPI003C2AE7A1
MPSLTPTARALSTLLTRHPRHVSRKNPSKKKPHKKSPKTPEETPAQGPTTYMRATIHSISSILRSSSWDSARSQLQLLPLRWDSFTVNRVLKTHPPMEKAYLFFRWADVIPGFKHDRFTYTTMLDIFGEAGRIASMRQVFDEMSQRGIVPDGATYTSVMHWLAKNRDLDGAVRAWGEMRRSGCRPTVVSYTALMKVLFDHGRAEEAGGVYREMMEVGLLPNCHTYTVLMEYLAGAGKFDAALDIMREMQEAGVLPDKATCNILVQKCAKAGETSAMTQVLLYMKDHSIVLRCPIFLEALKALETNGESDCLLREVNPHMLFEGIDDDYKFESTATDSISMIDRGIIVNLLMRKNWIALEHVISGMTNNLIDLDSSIILEVVQDSCANSKPSCALAAFHYCLRMGKELKRSAYSCLIGFFIREYSFQLVLEIVEEMIKAGCNLGTYLSSILIYRLGCAGLPSYAAKIFNLSPTDQNTVTCTALIYAYLQAGEVDKGIKLYSKMRGLGIPASSGTYEVLIQGLEKAGRIHDAEAYRKERRKLQWREYSAKGGLPEESLCNCLFSGDHA